MLRAWSTVPLICCFVATCVCAGSDQQPVKWTGWFSDEHCASARASGGVFTATNPDCAKTCIEKGAAVVFISEQAKAVLKVTGYAKAEDDLGYHIELEGTLDPAHSILSVTSVKRLEYTGAACARPKKTAK